MMTPIAGDSPDPLQNCDVPALEVGPRLRGRTAAQRSKKGSEKVLGRVLRRVLRRRPAMWVLRGVLRRGSEKGVSRRCLERPLGEYDPLGIRPIEVR